MTPYGCQLSQQVSSVTPEKSIEHSKRTHPFLCYFNLQHAVGPT
jgi:hypothetical protein